MSELSQNLRWHPCPDQGALQEAARDFILAAAGSAIAGRDEFHLVLAGGNTPRAIYASLCSAPTDWSKWHVYFGDERCLPADDAGRNSRMAGAAWLDRVPIPAAQVHAIPGELGAAAAAEACARALAAVGDFDLVLLGLGEDGHTASLFPGKAWGEREGSPDALAIHDAPKPPPERVSLSAARLSRTRAMLFIVSGEEKRAAVDAWRAGARLPVSVLRAAAPIEVLVDARLLLSGAG